MRSHSLPAILLRIGKSFHHEPPWVAQGYGSHKEWNDASTMDEGTLECAWSSLALSCDNKTPLLSSPRCSDPTAGLGWNSTHTWDTGDCGPLRHVLFCSNGPWWSQKSVNITFPSDAGVRNCLWVMVSWNGAILCLPSMLPAGSSGPSFHTQSQRTSGNHRFPFRAVAKFLSGVRPGVFPSVRESLV